MSCERHQGRKGAAFGHPVTTATREKLRKAHLGKKPKLTAEARKKMSEGGRKGGKVPWSGTLPFPMTDEHRRNIALGHRGMKMHPNTHIALMRANTGHHRQHSPETKEKLRQARLKQRFPNKMTSIELILWKQFKQRRLRFEMHKTLFSRFQPDFVFEAVKLIVQADGDYWHRQRKPPGDKLFNEIALSEGWTVWRFAESEIRMHPEACGKAVARFVRCH